jgi:glycine cleavage system transcriptional repressor
LGLELDLLTMTKRTSAQHTAAVSVHYVLEYTGKDKTGTLGAIATLLANHQVYIGALRTETKVDASNQQLVNHSTMTLQLPQGAQVDVIKHEVLALLEQLQLSGSFEAQL